MAETTAPSLLQQLNWRYATKSFDPSRKIGGEDWSALEEALVLTPSSFGLQPWKFIVVQDPALREELAGHAWGQRQVIEASHLVVFATVTRVGDALVDRHLARVAEVRGVPVDSLEKLRGTILGSVVNGPRASESAHWAKRQTYIALGNFLTSTALLGIDACPMEGFQPAKFDEVLGLPERGLTATVLCAAGYRAEDDKYSRQAKVRFAPKDVVEYR